MIKRDEIASADSCLNKAKDTEPLFVLRAHDALAPIVVRIWAILAKWVGVNEAKVKDARDTAISMTAWRDRKLPD